MYIDMLIYVGTLHVLICMCAHFICYVTSLTEEKTKHRTSEVMLNPAFTKKDLTKLLKALGPIKHIADSCSGFRQSTWHARWMFTMHELGIPLAYLWDIFRIL